MKVNFIIFLTVITLNIVPTGQIHSKEAHSPLYEPSTRSLVDTPLTNPFQSLETVPVLRRPEDTTELPPDDNILSEFPDLENGDFSDFSIPQTAKYRVILEPVSRTRYYAQVQVIAPVVTLAAKVGDSFRKGDLLLQLDPGKFKALYLKAQAALEKSRIELESKERLYQDGNTSYFDYLEAKSNLASAQAEVIFAEKNLEAISVVAPYYGKVSLVSIEMNEIPLENREMIELIDDSTLIGKVLMPSTLYNQIKIGDSVEIVLDETKENFKAKISRISGFIDPSSSTFKIEIDIDNSKGKLWTGMGGAMTLTSQGI